MATLDNLIVMETNDDPAVKFVAEEIRKSVSCSEKSREPETPPKHDSVADSLENPISAGNVFCQISLAV